MLRAHARKLARRLVSSSSLVARSASSIEHIHTSSSALHAKKTKKPIKKRIGNKNTKLVVPCDAEKDHWKAIIDEESDKIYYWNTKTNETTRLGDPKPSSLSGSPTDAQRSRNRQLKNRKDDDALFVPSFESSDVRADANGIAVQMGTVFLFGIGAAFGVTFVAAAFGFR